jgi:hypothetical protein
MLPPGLEPETFASLNIQIEVLVRRSNQLSYGSRPIVERDTRFTAHEPEHNQLIVVHSHAKPRIVAVVYVKRKQRVSSFGDLSKIKCALSNRALVYPSLLVANYIMPHHSYINPRIPLNADGFLSFFATDSSFPLSFESFRSRFCVAVANRSEWLLASNRPASPRPNR